MQSFAASSVVPYVTNQYLMVQGLIIMSTRPQLLTPQFVLRDVRNSDDSQLKNTVTALTPVNHREGALVSGNSDGSILLWDIKEQKLLKKWIAHQNKGIIWLGVLEDDGFVSFGRDQILRIWKFEGNEVKETKNYHTDHVGFCSCDVFASQDQLMIALPLSNATVKIIYLDNDKDNSVLKDDSLLKSDIVTCLRFTHTLESRVSLLVGYESGHMSAWDIADNSLICKTLVEKDQPVLCFDFDSASRRGISCSIDTTIRIWQLQDNSFHEVTTREITNPGVACVRIRRDGKIVALGGWDHRIRVFSWRTMKPLAVLDFHRDTVQTLQFFPSADINVAPRFLLAAGSSDGCISFWDLYN